jgi:hypothetical protein
MKVSWDDDIPNIFGKMGKIKKGPGTHQIIPNILVGIIPHNHQPNG